MCSLLFCDNGANLSCQMSFDKKSALSIKNVIYTDRHGTVVLVYISLLLYKLMPSIVSISFPTWVNFCLNTIINVLNYCNCIIMTSAVVIYLHLLGNGGVTSSQRDNSTCRMPQNACGNNSRTASKRASRTINDSIMYITIVYCSTNAIALAGLLCPYFHKMKIIIIVIWIEMFWVTGSCSIS